MSPLFTEKQEESLKRSGKLITWKKNEFIEIKEDELILNQDMQNRLWNASLKLCKDQQTTQIAEHLRSTGVSCFITPPQSSPPRNP